MYNLFTVAMIFLLVSNNKTAIVQIFIIFINLLGFWMRQKTESIADRFNQQKFQLQGWSNDLDDLVGSNNLLKILQKKITFPVLENNLNNRKKVHKKVQTLPIVNENIRKIPSQINLGTTTTQSISPRMYVEKVIKKVKNQSENKQSKILMKSKTQKKKLSVIKQVNYQGNAAEKSENMKKKDKRKKNQGFNKSYLDFYQSIKTHDRAYNGQIDQTQSNANNFIKTKNNKLASVESFPIKARLAIFNEYIEKDSKEKQKENEQKKHIKWERFSLSQQKFVANPDKITKISTNNLASFTKNGIKQDSQEKLSKLDEKVDYNKMFWMQKILQKNKFHIKKIVKTQSNDFLDDHLQPYIQRQRQRLKNRQFNL